MTTQKLSSNRIKRNELIRVKITQRLRELRRTLSSNGNADFQVEYEALHRLIGKKLPKDYGSEFYE